MSCLNLGLCVYLSVNRHWKCISTEFHNSIISRNYYLKSLQTPLQVLSVSFSPLPIATIFLYAPGKEAALLLFMGKETLLHPIYHANVIALVLSLLFSPLPWICALSLQARSKVPMLKINFYNPPAGLFWLLIYPSHLHFFTSYS